MPSKVIKLTETDLNIIVSKILKEQKEKIYNKHDSVYDYKVVNNSWYGKKKNGVKWFSLKKYPKSIKKLNDTYPNALGKQSSVSNTPLKLTSKPISLFKSEEEGNEFRGWMNKYYPDTSKKLQLDVTGKYDNSYIKKALNGKVKRKDGSIVTFGELYSIKHLKKTDLSLFDRFKKFIGYTPSPTKEKIEAGAYKIPNEIPNADRLNKELYYINARPKYNGKPFVMVDPRLNLVLAFDAKHKLVDYSQTVAGADKQKDVLFTRKMWCESSHKDNSFTNFKGYEQCIRTINGKVHTSIESYADEKVGYLENIYEYPMLSKLKARYAQKGIYGISNKYFQKGYQGEKGTPNSFGLKKDGISVGTAIHALVPIESRITADAELQKLLQKDLNSGTIPKEYIDMVEKDFLSSSKVKKFDKSSGCFNVDPKFIQDSKVQKVFNYPGVPVFIMGEKDTDYLVQVEPGKEGEFMLDLGGKNGKCTSPNGLSNTYGTQVGLA